MRSLMKSYGCNLRTISRKINKTIRNILVLQGVSVWWKCVSGEFLLRPRQKPFYQRPLLLFAPAQETAGHSARMRSRGQRRIWLSFRTRFITTVSHIQDSQLLTYLTVSGVWDLLKSIWLEKLTACRKRSFKEYENDMTRGDLYLHSGPWYAVHIISDKYTY